MSIDFDKVKGDRYSDLQDDNEINMISNEDVQNSQMDLYSDTEEVCEKRQQKGKMSTDSDNMKGDLYSDLQDDNEANVIPNKDVENSQLDLYSDILTAELCEKQQQNRKAVENCQKLQKENTVLQDQLKMVNSNLQMIKKQNVILKYNMSSLYKTAKAEIDRKDMFIQELTEKLDKLIFRRNTNQLHRYQTQADGEDSNNKEDELRERKYYRKSNENCVSKRKVLSNTDKVSSSFHMESKKHLTKEFEVRKKPDEKSAVEDRLSTSENVKSKDSQLKKPTNTSLKSSEKHKSSQNILKDKASRRDSEKMKDHHTIDKTHSRRISKVSKKSPIKNYHLSRNLKSSYHSKKSDVKCKRDDKRKDDTKYKRDDEHKDDKLKHDRHKNENTEYGDISQKSYNKKPASKESREHKNKSDKSRVEHNSKKKTVAENQISDVKTASDFINDSSRHVKAEKATNRQKFKPEEYYKNEQIGRQTSEIKEDVINQFYEKEEYSLMEVDSATVAEKLPHHTTQNLDSSLDDDQLLESNDDTCKYIKGDEEKSKHFEESYETKSEGEISEIGKNNALSQYAALVSKIEEDILRHTTEDELIILEEGGNKSADDETPAKDDRKVEANIEEYAVPTFAKIDELSYDESTSSFEDYQLTEECVLKTVNTTDTEDKPLVIAKGDITDDVVCTDLEIVELSQGDESSSTEDFDFADYDFTEKSEVNREKEDECKVPQSNEQKPQPDEQCYRNEKIEIPNVEEENVSEEIVSEMINNVCLESKILDEHNSVEETDIVGNAVFVHLQPNNANVASQEFDVENNHLCHNIMKESKGDEILKNIRINEEERELQTLNIISEQSKTSEKHDFVVDDNIANNAINTDLQIDEILCNESSSSEDFERSKSTIEENDENQWKSEYIGNHYENEETEKQVSKIDENNVVNKSTKGEELISEVINNNTSIENERDFMEDINIVVNKMLLMLQIDELLNMKRSEYGNEQSEKPISSTEENNISLKNEVPNKPDRIMDTDTIHNKWITGLQIVELSYSSSDDSDLEDNQFCSDVTKQSEQRSQQNLKYKNEQVVKLDSSVEEKGKLVSEIPYQPDKKHNLVNTDFEDNAVCTNLQIIEPSPDEKTLSEDSGLENNLVCYDFTDESDNSDESGNEEYETKKSDEEEKSKHCGKSEKTEGHVSTCEEHVFNQSIEKELDATTRVEVESCQKHEFTKEDNVTGQDVLSKGVEELYKSEQTSVDKEIVTDLQMDELSCDKSSPLADNHFTEKLESDNERNDTRESNQNDNQYVNDDYENERFEKQLEVVLNQEKVVVSENDDISIENKVNEMQNLIGETDAIIMKNDQTGVQFSKMKKDILNEVSESEEEFVSESVKDTYAGNKASESREAIGEVTIVVSNILTDLQIDKLAEIKSPPLEEQDQHTIKNLNSDIHVFESHHNFIQRVEDIPLPSSAPGSYENRQITTKDISKIDELTNDELVSEAAKDIPVKNKTSEKHDSTKETNIADTAVLTGLQAYESSSDESLSSSSSDESSSSSSQSSDQSSDSESDNSDDVERSENIQINLSTSESDISSDKSDDDNFELSRKRNESKTLNMPSENDSILKEKPAIQNFVSKLVTKDAIPGELRDEGDMSTNENVVGNLSPHSKGHVLSFNEKDSTSKLDYSNEKGNKKTNSNENNNNGKFKDLTDVSKCYKEDKNYENEIKEEMPPVMRNEKDSSQFSVDNKGHKILLQDKEDEYCNFKINDYKKSNESIHVIDLQTALSSEQDTLLYDEYTESEASSQQMILDIKELPLEVPSPEVTQPISFDKLNYKQKDETEKTTKAKREIMEEQELAQKENDFYKIVSGENAASNDRQKSKSCESEQESFTKSRNARTTYLSEKEIEQVTETHVISVEVDQQKNTSLKTNYSDDNENKTLNKYKNVKLVELEPGELLSDDEDEDLKLDDLSKDTQENLNKYKQFFSSETANQSTSYRDIMFKNTDRMDNDEILTKFQKKKDKDKYESRHRSKSIERKKSKREVYLDKDKEEKMSRIHRKDKDRNSHKSEKKECQNLVEEDDNLYKKLSIEKSKSDVNEMIVRKDKIYDRDYPLSKKIKLCSPGHNEQEYSQSKFYEMDSKSMETKSAYEKSSSSRKANSSKREDKISYILEKLDREDDISKDSRHKSTNSVSEKSDTSYKLWNVEKRQESKQTTKYPEKEKLKRSVSPRKREDETLDYRYRESSQSYKGEKHDSNYKSPSQDSKHVTKQYEKEKMKKSVLSPGREDVTSSYRYKDSSSYKDEKLDSKYKLSGKDNEKIRYTAKQSEKEKIKETISPHKREDERSRNEYKKDINFYKDENRDENYKESRQESKRIITKPLEMGKSKRMVSLRKREDEISNYQLKEDNEYYEDEKQDIKYKLCSKDDRPELKNVTKHYEMEKIKKIVSPQRIMDHETSSRGYKDVEYYKDEKHDNLHLKLSSKDSRQESKHTSKYHEKERIKVSVSPQRREDEANYQYKENSESYNDERYDTSYKLINRDHRQESKHVTKQHEKIKRTVSPSRRDGATSSYQYKDEKHDYKLSSKDKQESKHVNVTKQCEKSKGTVLSPRREDIISTSSYKDNDYYKDEKHDNDYKMSNKDKQESKHTTVQQEREKTKKTTSSRRREDKTPSHQSREDSEWYRDEKSRRTLSPLRRKDEITSQYHHDKEHKDSTKSTKREYEKYDLLESDAREKKYKHAQRSKNMDIELITESSKFLKELPPFTDVVHQERERLLQNKTAKNSFCLSKEIPDIDLKYSESERQSLKKGEPKHYDKFHSSNLKNIKIECKDKDRSILLKKKVEKLEKITKTLERIQEQKGSIKKYKDTDYGIYGISKDNRQKSNEKYHKNEKPEKVISPKQTTSKSLEYFHKENRDNFDKDYHVTKDTHDFRISLPKDRNYEKSIIKETTKSASSSHSRKRQLSSGDDLELKSTKKSTNSYSENLDDDYSRDERQESRNRNKKSKRSSSPRRRDDEILSRHHREYTKSHKDENTRRKLSPGRKSYKPFL